MLPDWLYTFIHKWEGGYINNPADIGGETNKGITYNTFKALATSLGIPNTYNKFRTLTDEEVNKFIDYFYRHYKANLLNDEKLAAAFTNFAWGSGKYAAYNLVKALNSLGFNLAKDSRINSKIAEAANKANKKQLLYKFLKVQESFYNEIVRKNPSQQIFLKGWLNRLEDLESNLNLPKKTSGSLLNIGLIFLTAFAIHKAIK